MDGCLHLSSNILRSVSPPLSDPPKYNFLFLFVSWLTKISPNGVQGKGESLVTWCRSHPFIIMTHSVWLNMIVGQQSSSSDCPVTERPRGFIPWCRSVLVQDTRLTRHGWLLWLKTMNEYPLWDQYYILNDPLCSLAFSHFSEAFTFDTTGLLNLNHSQLLSIDVWICGTPSTLPAAPLILIATTVWE